MSVAWQKELVRAAENLGLEVIAPYTFELPSGLQLNADALFPELGAPKGTIVVALRKAAPSVAHELHAIGYTMSSMSEPIKGQDFDLDSYREMFKEWGWSSEARERPSWLVVAS